MVEAAQDDAGEVDWLHEDAEQGALDAHHVPPAAEGRDTPQRGLCARRSPDVHLPCPQGPR